jgi:hypothetical protein
MINTGRTRVVFHEKIVSIHRLKTRIPKKFPNSEIANILLNEPDEMSIEALISKVGTWLVLLDLEKQQVLNSSIQNNMEAK